MGVMGMYASLASRTCFRGRRRGRSGFELEGIANHSEE
jgi:hypothetical protein